MTWLCLSVNRLSSKPHVAESRLQGLVREQRGITPETAICPGRYFGTTPAFCLDLRRTHDSSEAKPEMVSKVEKKVEPGVT